MPERKELDRPATVILTVCGLAFIAVSVPFLPFLYCQSPSHNPDLCPPKEGSLTSYDVAWSKSAIGTDQVASLNSAGDASASLTVAGSVVAEVHVRISKADCQDTYNSNFQNPALISWTLANATGTVADSGAPQPCAAVADQDILILVHEAPKLAGLQAANDTAAVANVTAQIKPLVASGAYTLTLHAARQASTVPPVPGNPGNLDPTLSVKITLSGQRWDAAISKATATGVGK